MKSRILVLLLVLVLSISCLFACDTGSNGGNNGGGGDNTGDEVKNYDDYLFGGEIIPVIILDETVEDTTDGKDASDGVYHALNAAAGDVDYYYSDDSDLPEEGDHEIVIGPSNRSVTRKAMRKLRMVQRNSDYHSAYLIYASGSSVAIVYDDDMDNLAAIEVLNLFKDKYLTGKTELDLKSGIVESGAINVLDYYTAKDKEYYEVKWAELAETIGGETGTAIVQAFQEMYQIYNHDVITWFANLYDPAVGGFYYSNSARDNGTYAPDTESTSQALGFVSNLGKVRAWRTGERANYADTLTETRKNEIVVYIKSLQDENGFFYNYQWDKAATDAKISRRARDLSWCVGILSSLGAQPTYTTPTGVKGDGVVVEGTYDDTILMKAPNRVGTSTAVAVSKVVLAAHAPEHESVETLKAYLAKLDASTSGSFYAVGNTMTSQMNQIVQRDKELRDEFYKDEANQGKTYVGLTETVIEFFNEHQDPTTGLWGQNAQQPANYAGVNGLLKISGVYNSAKVEIPYAEKAAAAAIAAITSDEKMGAVVDLYNTWFSVSNVLSNLRNYGTTAVVDGVEMDGKARADKIMLDLREIAAPAIIKSGVKISDFEKPDGSYSYTPLASSSTSQGMPVAVGGTNEGDVNATVIATNGLVGNIYSALGLSMVGIYGERDFQIFMRIFNDLGPVIKHTPLVVLGDEPISFDDQSVGDDFCDLNGNLPEGGYLIEKDTREGAKGNTVKIWSNATNMGTTVSVRNNSNNKAGNCYIFQTDLRVNKNSANGYCMQITMGGSYMFSLEVGGGKVRVFESTTASSTTARYITIASIDVDKWFNLRVEYYKNGLDGSSPRACFYIDGKLVAITDGFYGMTKQADGTYAGTPVAGTLTETKMYKMMSVKIDFNLDNVWCTCTNDAYKVPENAEGLVYNVDKDVKPVTPEA